MRCPASPLGRRTPAGSLRAHACHGDAPRTQPPASPSCADSSPAGSRRYALAMGCLATPAARSSASASNTAARVSAAYSVIAASSQSMGRSPAEQLRIVRMARPVGERFVFPERSPFHAWQLCVYRRRSGRRVTRSRRDKRHVVRPVASFGCGAARQRPRTAGVAGRYGPCGHQLHKARRGTVWRGKAWERPRATGGPLRPRGGVAVLASVARPRRRTTRAARPSAPPRAARYVAVNARRPLLCARSAPWRVAPWSRDRGS
jgi:hypothetical protein